MKTKIYYYILSLFNQREQLPSRQPSRFSAALFALRDPSAHLTDERLERMRFRCKRSACESKAWLFRDWAVFKCHLYLNEQLRRAPTPRFTASSIYAGEFEQTLLHGINKTEEPT